MKNNIKTHYLTPPFKDKARKVRVVLPKSYDDTEKTYPVLYMHDGQNVIFDKESFANHSWRVLEALQKDKTPEVIIVAIDNDGNNRLNEYVPWHYDKHGGLGDEYVSWIVEDIKPFIDQMYRTKKDKRYTGIAGSSLGGLISAYAGAKYPDIFGVLGVFSLASWVSEEKFLNFIKSNPLDKDTFVYIQTGTHEAHEVEALKNIEILNQTYIDNAIRYMEKLLMNNHPIDNLSLNIYYKETHFEKYWAKHFHEFLIKGFNDV